MLSCVLFFLGKKYACVNRHVFCMSDLSLELLNVLQKLGLASHVKFYLKSGGRQTVAILPNHITDPQCVMVQHALN